MENVFAVPFYSIVFLCVLGYIRTRFEVGKEHPYEYLVPGIGEMTLIAVTGSITLLVATIIIHSMSEVEKLGVMSFVFVPMGACILLKCISILARILLLLGEIIGRGYRLRWELKS
jgi:hypothetical protein